jgi:hypothetical protein
MMTTASQTRWKSEMGQSLPGRAASKQGHVRYVPKGEASSLLRYLLMATHMTSFPRNNLSKVGAVPFQKT